MIHYLRQLGFDGPFAGGNHEFMKKDALKIRVPNPHKSDIDKNLLIRVLKQAAVEKEDWENLK